MNNDSSVRPEELEGQIKKNPNNLNHKNVPRAPSADAKALADMRDERITEQIQMQNLFGTDGIRARVGVFPLTEYDLVKLGNAIGIWAVKKYGAAPHFLMGHDTRESAQFMIDALSAGLLQHPINLSHAGVLPTPAIIKLAQMDETFDGAIIITASHNPYQDNGLKIVDAHNGKLSLEDEQAITTLFYSQKTQSTLLGSTCTLKDSNSNYLNALASYFQPQFLRGKKIVLDCANGATSAIAPALFEQLGAEVIALNIQPNGCNINENCGATHPEIAQHAVITHQADIGFAFDGDGDRVVAISKEGMIKDGDDILALLLNHPVYAEVTGLVCTIMSNGGLDIYTQSKQKTLVRTPVGDKYVSAELKNSNLLIGGEQSGHILLADFLLSSDALFAALRICETALLNNNWGLNSFDRFAQVLINMAVSEKRDLQAPDLQAIISNSKASLGSGTLVIRYSGTENLLRIMVQHQNQAFAQSVAEQLVKNLEPVL